MMVKDNLLNVRLSTEETLNLNLFAQARGISISDLVRETLKEKIMNESPAFLKKKEEELKKQLEDVGKQLKLVELKEKETKNISRKERDFLIKSKEILENNPLYVDGQIAHYLSLFKKPYKISTSDYYKLLQEVSDGK